MAWNWWQRICEHNQHLGIPSPHPKTLTSEHVVVFVLFFTCFGTQNRFFLMLPEKYLTGVGQKDADWKVSASQIDMNFGPWTESSKYELKHLLPTKWWIWGLWVFSWFLESIFRLGNLGLGGWGNRLGGSGGTRLDDSFAVSLRHWVRTLLGKPS